MADSQDLGGWIGGSADIVRMLDQHARPVRGWQADDPRRLPPTDTRCRDGESLNEELPLRPRMRDRSLLVFVTTRSVFGMVTVALIAFVLVTVFFKPRR
jgi:hypothetical protein